MKLHQNEGLFRQAVQFTAQEMDISPIFVEKDYWVTYTLYSVFNSKIASETVFKGGTSLLKCYGLLKRFSEDIDLVVLRRENESNNKLTSKIRTITDIVSNVLPEVPLPGVTVKMGMNRKTAHAYPKLFTGNFGQIRNVIIVEANWLGCFEPYGEMPVSSFIYDIMMREGQEDVAAEYALLPFATKVLSPTRTICEKIMSLVRFSYSENPVKDLRLKIRHTYDIYQLLQTETLSSFFNSYNFEEMLVKVGRDDIASYKSNNQWLRNHPNESLIFSDPGYMWGQLKDSYETDFRALVYGNEFPAGDDILQTLQNIKKRMEVIDWNVKVPGA